MTRGADPLAATVALALLALPGAGANPPDFAAEVRPVAASELAASWRPGCPVPPDDLRQLALAHWGFDGAVHTGRLVVHRDAVPALVAAFEALFEARFPVRRMEPVEAFDGDDGRSMAADNTSAFNCRRSTGASGGWSRHAYGLAVDLNPLENPYVSGGTVLPPEGRAFLRPGAEGEPGVVRVGGVAVRAFEAVGWRWGGDWEGARDYQHFSADGR